jgi:hypothetical protein
LKYFRKTALKVNFFKYFKHLMSMSAFNQASMSGFLQICLTISTAVRARLALRVSVTQGFDEWIYHPSSLEPS